MSEHERENRTMDDISLESILAEYKSDAYIAGDKKTPKKTLDEQAEQILREALGSLREPPPTEQVEVQIPAPTPEPIEPPAPAPQPEPEPAPPPQPAPDVEQTQAIETPPITTDSTILLPTIAEIAPAAVVEEPPAPRPSRWKKPRKKLAQGEIVEISLPSKDKPDEPPPAPLLPTLAEEIELDESAFTDTPPEAVAEESAPAQEEPFEDPEARLDDEDEGEESLLSRFRRNKKENAFETHGLHEEEGTYDEEDLEEDGQSLRQAAGVYGTYLSKYQVRGVLTIMLSLLMLLFTIRGDAGASLPGFLNTAPGLTVSLLIMQLLAMLLTVEVITTGLLDIIRRRPGVETLVTVAALASIADIIYVLQFDAADRGLPYSAVVAFSLGTALLGIKSVRNAMKLTLRTAATWRNPYVVSSKLGALDEGFALFKSRLDTEGFVRKTQQMDFSEYIYSMAAPLLIVASAVFALLAAFGGTEDPWDAIHHFAGMTAVSASFTGLLAYGIPYGLLSRKLSKVGAALAGWGGAAEVHIAKGVIVTDADVFPAGTLSLSGVKIFDKSNPEKILAYTGSVIIASGCGLSEVFQDTLNMQKLTPHPVTDLACYEGGGIGAKINEEDIIVGSASLMNLMGIRLPQNLPVKNAVFTAMGGELVGVFAINYTPLNSVKEALVSLLHSKIHPLFAVRDFNVTPIMLQTKFQITTDKIDFLTYKERYALNGIEPDPQAKPFAVLCREGLGPLADIVVGGKRLRTAVIRNTILSIASSVIGLALLLSFFWAGAADTVSAANVFYYNAAWLFVMYLLSRTVTLD